MHSSCVDEMICMGYYDTLLVHKWSAQCVGRSADQEHNIDLNSMY